MPVQTHEFMAIVLEDSKDGYALIEQRNRFKVGETLEVLSPNKTFNARIEVIELLDEKGEKVLDASLVQQKLRIKTNLNLKAGDFLRNKLDK